MRGATATGDMRSPAVRFLIGLIRPAERLTDPGERLQASIMAAVLLTLIIVTAGSMLVIIIVQIAVGTTPDWFAVIRTTLLGLLLAIPYLLSRKGLHQTSTMIAITLLIIFPAMTIFNPADGFDATDNAPLLVFPILVSGLLMPLWGLVATTLIAVAIVVVAMVLMPSEAFFLTQPLAILLLSGSVMTMALVVRRYQQDRAAQFEAEKQDIELVHTAHLEREKIQQHRQKLETLGSLIAGLAHEINNPVHMILNLSEVITEAVDPESLPARFTEDLTAQSRRLTQVTSNLLDFIRPTAPDVGPVDLARLVSETTAMTNPAFLDAKVSLVLDVGDAVEVESNRTDLQQVLLNLLMNAVAMTDRSGSVTVRLAENEDGVKIEVSDDGPGVPEDLRDSIFEPFFTTKAPGEGTGLGLSLSRSIMEKNGGQLTLADANGGGATFVMSLPTGV